MEDFAGEGVNMSITRGAERFSWRAAAEKPSFPLRDTQTVRPRDTCLLDHYHAGWFLKYVSLSTQTHTHTGFDSWASPAFQQQGIFRLNNADKANEQKIKDSDKWIKNRLSFCSLTLTLISQCIKLFPLAIMRQIMPPVKIYFFMEIIA